jgi:hypothetical protein
MTPFLPAEMGDAVIGRTPRGAILDDSPLSTGYFRLLKHARSLLTIEHLRENVVGAIAHKIKWNRRLPELLVLLFFIAYTTVARVMHLFISDDSTNYIAASRSLINSGELLVCINWHSKM